MREVIRVLVREEHRVATILARALDVVAAEEFETFSIYALDARRVAETGASQLRVGADDLTQIRELVRTMTAVRARVAAAAKRSGRDAHAVTLVGVGKLMSEQQVVAAVRAGLYDLAENYVQESVAKIPAVEAERKDLHIKTGQLLRFLSSVPFHPDSQSAGMSGFSKVGRHNAIPVELPA